MNDHTESMTERPAERPIEQRLRAALSARADLVDEPALGAWADDLTARREGRRWRAAAVAAAATVAVAASVALAVGIGTGDEPDIEPAPAPTTPGTTAPEGTAEADLDADGETDRVTVQGRRLTVRFSDGTTTSVRVPRGVSLDGLADVGADRPVVVTGFSLHKVGADRTLSTVVLDGTPPEQQWVGAEGQLLTGTSHVVEGTEVITAYAWTGNGRLLTPSADALYCPAPGADPEPCGTGDTFTGDADGLPELQPAPYETVGVGEGDVFVAQPGWNNVTTRLEGSTAGEVGDGDVELVIDTARLGLPAGPAPALLNASFRTGTDALVVGVLRAIGDSFDYDLYRYNGEVIEPVEVVETDGLTLAGGGPAAGGPYTEVFLGASGGFFSLRADSGIDLFQTAVQWTWDGDRLVGESLGVVCLDTLVPVLDVPGAYGDCGLPR